MIRLSKDAQLPDDLYELSFINNVKITEELLGSSRKTVFDATDTNALADRTITDLKNSAKSTINRMLAMDSEQESVEEEH